MHVVTDFTTTDIDTLLARYERFDPTLMADPYPLFARIRAERPVHRTGPRVRLTRYEDVALVLRDPRFSVNRNAGTHRITALNALAEPTRSQMAAMMAFTGQWMLTRDPPDHTRLRGLANRAFTPRVVALMRERIQRLVDDLLDRVQGHGEMDVIADLAYPLPVTVIAEMLGVPPADRDRIRRWSNEVLIFLSGFTNVATMADSIAEFRDYLRPLIADRRAAPREDLLSAFIVARDEGERLDEEELFAMCVLLLAAGHETTTNLIGNGLLTLLRHPDQLGALRDDPALVESAVEELLRYDCPLHFMARVAMEDCEIAGVPIEAGLTLTSNLAAANRDPARFPEPDRLDIARADNRHLSFGVGPHFCLGAALARIEGQIAFATILRRLPSLRLGVEAVEWRPNITVRGLTALPVVFGR